MRRTISAMVGKGSVNHNSRLFHAKNTDPERSYLNIEYVNEDIRDVYHEMFAEALEQYNEEQSRADRRIDDYYEKICNGKQEKPFHELIIQIGDSVNMNAQGKHSDVARDTLDEYMRSFRERNPNLRVFSAYMHMDEATPHLHIDFVPFTEHSTRGRSKRVSLKQALAEQGFVGGSRSATEWNLWVASEKEALSKVMERNGIEWEQRGTHEKHLSTIEFEKKMRSEEVEQLNEQVKDNLEKISETTKEIAERTQELSAIREEMTIIDKAAERLSEPEWNLPEPKGFMSIKSYIKQAVEPLINKFREALKTASYRYNELMNKFQALGRKTDYLKEQVLDLRKTVKTQEHSIKYLESYERNMEALENYFGEERFGEYMEKALDHEKMLARRETRYRYTERGDEFER